MSAEPFATLSSRTVVLADANIDTDQIIPARFLTTTTREGLGRAAFHDWRYEADGSPKRDCELNAVDTATHRVLVAGDNFGCGSSREHVPVVVPPAVHAELLEQPGREVTLDLQAQELRFGNHVARFEIDPFSRACLLEGVDPLGYVLNRLPAVEAFERAAAA